MKFTTAALSLGLASVATAKSVRNSYPVRRDPQGATFNFPGMRGFGISDTSVTQVFIIWANAGGQGVATTTFNQQVTVTQTVTVPVGGVATAIPGVDGVTTTIQQGATGVVAGTGATHSVTVGGPGRLTFQPDQLSANVGDMVVFTFLGNNHTATQSAFDTPCNPLAGGMDSGFMSNPNSTLSPAPQVAMQVMVAEPLWFFCAQNAHCGKGMTFSINPTAERTHALFQQLAISQNGNGANSAITGGQGAPPAAAPAAPPAAAPPVAAPAGTDALAPLPGSTDTLAPLPGASGVAGIPPVGAVTPGGVISGVGVQNPDGSCSCTVSCGAGSFPAIEAQGLGAFGGVAGIV
jgi:plastocyanin